MSYSSVNTDTIITFPESMANNNTITWGTGTSLDTNTIYTTNGTSGMSWALPDPNIKGTSIQVKGDAEFDGEVTIKGKNIADMFAKIEERLAILHPNLELEEKWENLRKLRDAYVELEREILEKEAIWNTLKR